MALKLGSLHFWKDESLVNWFPTSVPLVCGTFVICVTVSRICKFLNINSTKILCNYLKNILNITIVNGPKFVVLYLSKINLKFSELWIKLESSQFECSEHSLLIANDLRHAFDTGWLDTKSANHRVTKN